MCQAWLGANPSKGSRAYIEDWSTRDQDIFHNGGSHFPMALRLGDWDRARSDYNTMREIVLRQIK